MPQNRHGNRHPKTEHLKPTQFKPGQSGNPGGRPKKHPITEELRVIADEIDPKTGKTIARLLAEAMVKNALKGSRAHFQEICDRVEGKPASRVEISGTDGGVITLSIEELQEQLAQLLEPARVA